MMFDFYTNISFSHSILALILQLIEIKASVMEKIIMELMETFLKKSLDQCFLAGKYKNHHKHL